MQFDINSPIVLVLSAATGICAGRSISLLSRLSNNQRPRPKLPSKPISSFLWWTQTLAADANVMLVCLILFVMARWL